MRQRLFTKHVQKALEWVNDINQMLRWNRKAYALDALRAVLHQLRDNLPISEAVHLGAQLPLVIRGLYFESWKPSRVPLKQRKKDIFIESVTHKLEQYMRKSFNDKNVEFIIKAVVQTLANHIDEGELDKLFRELPGELRYFMAEITHDL